MYIIKMYYTSVATSYSVLLIGCVVGVSVTCQSVLFDEEISLNQHHSM